MTGIQVNLDQAAGQLDPSNVDPEVNNSFTGQIGNTENDGVNFTGWNPNDWKYDDSLGGAQVYLAANPGGDNGGTSGAGGFYVFSSGNSDANNDGSVDGTGAGVGNADIFTALDNDGSDLGARTGSIGNWIDSLRNNKVLTGLGVAGLVNGSEGGATNQAVTNNTEIQSAAGIGAADQLLVDFGQETTSAKFELGLFYSMEKVNWSKNSDGTYNTLPGANSKDAEGMTYELLKSVAPGTAGSKTVGGRTYLSVGTGVTSAYASGTGSFAAGTPVSGEGNFNGNPGLSTVSINSAGGATFDAIVFGGQDYFKGTPTAPGFKANDVSDYLLNGVSILDENIVGGSGEDTINGGDGNDILAGGPGTYTCYDGNNPQDWINDGVTLSGSVVGGGTVNYNSSNADVFTALDGNTNDLNSSANSSSFLNKINSLVNNKQLSGIGVGDPNGGYNNQELPSNPEIQGDSNSNSQITEGDKLKVDFGDRNAHTAKVTVNLFYSKESVSVNDNGTVTNLGNRPEQLKYQLYNDGVAVGGQTLVTAKNTGTFSVSNKGEFTFLVNSKNEWDVIEFIGEDYGKTTLGGAYPDPLVGNPSDVSDYLLKSVCLNDDGNDVLTGGAGADTFQFKGISGVDTIVDFNAAQGDVIQIDKSAFLSAYGISMMSDASFRNRFSYSGGVLKFDVDYGYQSWNQYNGGRPSIDIATLTGTPSLNLTSGANQFQIVASIA